MFKNLLSKVIIWSLGTTRLDNEHKARITSKLLDNLGAIPLSDVIKISDTGQLVVDGKILDVEHAILLRESAETMQHSFANRLIQQQLTYEAIKMGVHQGLNTDMIIFSKAALWYIQETKKLLTTITQK